MTKNFYFACVANENNKNYAFMIKCGRYENMMSKLDGGVPYGKIVICQPCETKKFAEACVHTWNKDFQNNGTWMFSGC